MAFQKNSYWHCWQQTPKYQIQALTLKPLGFDSVIARNLIGNSWVPIKDYRLAQLYIRPHQKWRQRTTELLSKEFCDFPANSAAVKLKSPGWFIQEEQANITVNTLQSTTMYFLWHFFSSLRPHLPFINIYNPHH